jgi:hypothetical protein
MHTAHRQPALAVLPAERYTDIGIRSAPPERAAVEAESARRGR